MDPIVVAILLLCFGLALVAIEFFIPSGGLIGIVAGISILAAIFFAYKGWYHSNPTAFYVFLIVVVMMIPVTVVGTLWIMPRTKFGNRVLLEAPKLEDVTPFAEEQAKLEKLIGQIGTTVTMLNPGGMVTVDGERFHCESPGLILDPGSEVEVFRIEGNRLVVRPPAPDRKFDVPAQEPKSESEFDNDGDSDGPPTANDSAPLDFEVP